MMGSRTENIDICMECYTKIQTADENAEILLDEFDKKILRGIPNDQLKKKARRGIDLGRITHLVQRFQKYMSGNFKKYNYKNFQKDAPLPTQLLEKLGCNSWEKAALDKRQYLAGKLFDLIVNHGRDHEQAKEFDHEHTISLMYKEEKKRGPVQNRWTYLAGKFSEFRDDLLDSVEQMEIDKLQYTEEELKKLKAESNKLLPNDFKTQVKNECSNLDLEDNRKNCISIILSLFVFSDSDKLINLSTGQQPYPRVFADAFRYVSAQRAEELIEEGEMDSFKNSLIFLTEESRDKELLNPVHKLKKANKTITLVGTQHQMATTFELLDIFREALGKGNLQKKPEMTIYTEINLNTNELIRNGGKAAYDSMDLVMALSTAYKKKGTTPQEVELVRTCVGNPVTIHKFQDGELAEGKQSFDLIWRSNGKEKLEFKLQNDKKYKKLIKTQSQDWLDSDKIEFNETFEVVSVEKGSWAHWGNMKGARIISVTFEGSDSEIAMHKTIFEDAQKKIRKIKFNAPEFGIRAWGLEEVSDERSALTGNVMFNPIITAAMSVFKKQRGQSKLLDVGKLRNVSFRHACSLQSFNKINFAQGNAYENLGPKRNDSMVNKFLEQCKDGDIFAVGNSHMQESGVDDASDTAIRGMLKSKGWESQNSDGDSILKLVQSGNVKPLEMRIKILLNLWKNYKKKLNELRLSQAPVSKRGELMKDIDPGLLASCIVKAYAELKKGGARDEQSPRKMTSLALRICQNNSSSLMHNQTFLRFSTHSGVFTSTFDGSNRSFKSTFDENLGKYVLEEKKKSHFKVVQDSEVTKIHSWFRRQENILFVSDALYGQRLDYKTLKKDQRKRVDTILSIAQKFKHDV